LLGVAATQRVETGSGRTWTVVGSDHLPVEPVEEFLEFMRIGRDASPNTIRSYATSLARWWEYVESSGVAWDTVTLPMFMPFVTMLRSGDPAGVVRLPTARIDSAMAAESTVGLRVAAVLSFYRYHADVHDVPVAGRLYRVGGHRRRSGYVRGLAHLDRHSGAASPMVRVRDRAPRPTPVLSPDQVMAILDDRARLDASGCWVGTVRDRLLFATLNETGMRLGECLSTRHCDWHVGRGGTPFVEVVPRQDHPAGARIKNSRYRRIYISDELERLHSEYVWQLCDADAPPGGRSGEPLRARQPAPRPVAGPAAPGERL
jgi:site-specific recombinase XerD